MHAVWLSLMCPPASPATHSGPPNTAARSWHALSYSCARHGDCCPPRADAVYYSAPLAPKRRRCSRRRPSWYGAASSVDARALACRVRVCHCTPAVAVRTATPHQANVPASLCEPRHTLARRHGAPEVPLLRQADPPSGRRRASTLHSAPPEQRRHAWHGPMGAPSKNSAGPCHQRWNRLECHVGCPGQRCCSRGCSASARAAAEHACRSQQESGGGVGCRCRAQVR